MRHLLSSLLLVAVCVFVAAEPARAQAPTGTVAGRVVSSDGQPLPGVTVSVTSPNLQRGREAVTSTAGDYLVTLLPPGTYRVSFRLTGFQTVEQTHAVAGTQHVIADATLAVAALNESVNVVGSAQPFGTTAQVATNFKQDLMALLPSNRTIDAVLLMAPAVHPTGPRGAYTINGSQSYENLYTLNGAIINENLRGAPMTPYIEDAIQEVTVISAGVSAEYGRFAGGVANAVTKSGGNSLSGSFRTSFANDSWRSFTPFESTQLIVKPDAKPADYKLDTTVPTYEATVGGPVLPDRLWYFAAMRSQKQASNLTTVLTNVPYTRTNDEQRYEGKVTVTPRMGQSLQGSFFKLNQTLRNFTGQNVADVKSLTNQGQPQSLVSLHYTGMVTPTFSLSVQYSARKLAFTNAGAMGTDRVLDTVVFDLAGGVRYWSPTFCAGSVCGDGDEQRNNNNFVVKGSYFLSRGAGAHHLVFGYDRFNDNIIANTHGSGSGYRIRGTSARYFGDEIFPVFVPNSTTTLERNAFLAKSEGSNLRVHSAFINDTWRVGNNVTLNLGVRLDKNAATDGDGDTVGDDLSFSPRVSAAWDPTGDAVWSVSGSFARYTMALTSNLAASTAQAGNLATYRWTYQGPAINANPSAPKESLVSTEEAIRQVFAWHDSNNGDNRLPYALVSIPGVNMQIREPLSSPYSMEYSGGLSRTLGRRGTVRGDLVFRNFRNFYELHTDLSTGRIRNAQGAEFDLSVIDNTDRTERSYVGLTTQGTYEFDAQLSVGANYTLSRASGNLDGETVNGGPSGAQVNHYPEYREAAWNYPTGDLGIDQRHRARMWATYQVPALARGTMVIGLLQQVGSGVPYAAVSFVNPLSFKANPGYLSPPGGLEYYFLGRDPFRTETTYRTDLSVNYGHRLGQLGGARPELFVHGELLNVFNQFQLCGCGENVFRNGGISDMTKINQSVAILQPQFNPYTTQPVEGTHWMRTANFGKAIDRFAYTSPRTFRFSAGVRF